MRIKQDNPNTKEYWDAVYQREKEQGIRRENFWRFDKIIEKIKDGDKVLEVGCGKGEFAEYLKNKRKVDYTGCDISDVAPIQCDCHKLPFKDKEFDIVVSIEVLEHIDNPQQFIKEAQRVGKRIAMITPYQNSIQSTEHIWSFYKQDIDKMTGGDCVVENGHIII